MRSLPHSPVARHDEASFDECSVSRLEVGEVEEGAWTWTHKNMSIGRCCFGNRRRVPPSSFLPRGDPHFPLSSRPFLLSRVCNWLCRSIKRVESVDHRIRVSTYDNPRPPPTSIEITTRHARQLDCATKPVTFRRNGQLPLIEHRELPPSSKPPRV